MPGRPVDIGACSPPLAEVVGVLSGIPLFQELSRNHLKQVAQMVRIREVPKGEVLVREGRVSREFFIILSGMAAVTARGIRQDTCRAGQFFGEFALLGRSATATVTALTRTSVGVISARDFQAFLEGEPRVGLHMIQVRSRGET